MNDIPVLLQQLDLPTLNREFVHLALAGIAAVFGGITTLCGGLALFLVKRAIAEHDRWKRDMEAQISSAQREIARIERGLTRAPTNRP